MCGTLVILTDATFHSLTQTLPELLSKGLWKLNTAAVSTWAIVCNQLWLILLEVCFKMLHYILFMDCSKLFRHLCHAYYLAHFRLLCIIFVGSVYQEVGPVVLVTALTAFLLDLSFQQSTWVLKGDNNTLDALPKSILLLEWNKMQNKKDIYIFEGKKKFTFLGELSSLPWLH